MGMIEMIIGLLIFGCGLFAGIFVGGHRALRKQWAANAIDGPFVIGLVATADGMTGTVTVTNPVDDEPKCRRCGLPICDHDGEKCPTFSSTKVSV